MPKRLSSITEILRSISSKKAFIHQSMVLRYNKSMTVLNTPKKREYSLDFIRGTAVFLMILAHAVYFFHGDSNQLLCIIGRTGNVICFTVFLFISGASAYFSSLADGRKFDAKKIIRRTFFILMGYYVLAITAAAGGLSSLSVKEAGGELIKIILFLKLFSFTEFLVTFILLSIFIVPFRGLLFRISRSFKMMVFVSLACYIAGYLIYPLIPGSPLRELKALFFGDPQILTFPLMQYMPVYLFGLYWGNLLALHESKEKRDSLILKTGMIFAAISIIAALITNFYPVGILDPFKRWPPSVGFLSLGLAAAFLLKIFYSYLSHTRLVKLLLEGFYYLGRDAYDLVIVHLLVLFFYRYFIDRQVEGIIPFFGLFALLLAITILIASANWKRSPSLFTIHSLSFGKDSKYRVRKRYIFSALLFLGIVVINLNHRLQASQYGDTIDPAGIIGPKYEPLSTELSVSEWITEPYSYRLQLDISDTESFRGIETGEIVSVKLPVKELLAQKKIRSETGEFYITYYTDRTFVPVSFIVQNDNAILFRVTEKIFPQGHDNRYFIYYGSDFPVKTDGLDNLRVTEVATRAVLGREQQNPKLLTISRQWYFKTLPQGTTPVSPVLDLRLDPLLTLSPEAHITYEIANTSVNEVMESLGNNRYQAVADISGLAVGEYAAYATITRESGQKEKSMAVKIMISEPVYVAWSLDWEGWDVPNANLEAIDTLVKKHGYLPLTHFFNPRIYLPSVMSKERAAFLTAWARNRTGAYGDSIDLHFHMQFDFVEAVGVTPKKEPRWGYGSGDGYDVLATAYSEDEIQKMLAWSKARFAENGLAAPKGFRMGGWFVDLDVLRALEKEGFVFDSSGREQAMWNSALKSPWNLHSKTQPYYPSRTDQNKTDTNPFSLLEIPNNGGDNYAYSAEQLKNRFHDNYDSKPVKDQTAVVFLSHPQLHHTDGAKIDEFLNETDRSLYEVDRGPVIYSTVNQIWSAFK